MDTVTVQIDVTRPAGRKLVRTLRTKRVVAIHPPNPADTGVWHKWEDVAEKGCCTRNINFVFLRSNN